MRERRTLSVAPLRAFADRRLGLRAFRVLGALCSQADADPEDPRPLSRRNRIVDDVSLQDLANLTAIDRGGIPFEISGLISLGYLLRDRGRRGGTSRYIILVEPVSCEDVTPVMPGRDKVSCQDVQSVVPRRDPYREKKNKRDAPFASESRARPSEPQPYPKNQSELLMPIDGGVSASSAHSHNGGKRNGQTGTPVDRSLSAEDREYALQAGYDDEWIAVEFQKFRNYRSQPAAKAVTWLRWVDRAPDFADHGGTARRTRPQRQGIIAGLRDVVGGTGMGKS